MTPVARIAELESTNARLQSDYSALQSNLSSMSTAYQSLEADYENLKQQLAWFQRQVFGEKSEKRLEIDEAIQPSLLAALGVPEVALPPLPTETITYTRRSKVRTEETVLPAGLRFTDDAVIEEIQIDDPAFDALPDDQKERIGEKVSWRIVQRPSSYAVLKMIRPVYKLTLSGEIVCAEAPPAIFPGCTADVSVLAGLMIDKGLYHLPIYRQHQRMTDGGLILSRQTPLNWISRSLDLLTPIAAAMGRHIVETGTHLAMDETPLKASRAGPGKMKQAYLWPIYGDQDEVVFHYAPSRAHAHVQTFLKGFTGTLISDGYSAYTAYAKRHGTLTHALCWAHARRYFERAEKADPKASAEALALIGALYAHEQIIRDKSLDGESKLDYRTTHSEPIVHAFWQWCDAQLTRTDLTPKHSMSTALKYVRQRREGLQAFLSDPDIPIDTNHLERVIRAIPMGRRNWLFCWSELGAKHIAVLQSLLVTCRLQGVDPYTYFVDVLNRVSVHPDKDILELTPRIWKEKFGHDPLRSIVDIVAA